MSNDVPRNHGLTWEESHIHELCKYFSVTQDLVELGKLCGRTEVSIRCKLKSLKLIDDNGNKIESTPLPQPHTPFITKQFAYPTASPWILQDGLELYSPFTTDLYAAQSISTKENSMPFDLKIETKTFVNGHDVMSMSENDLIEVIYKTEQEIERLDMISHKPKAIQARKDALIASIMLLVNLLDARA